MRSHVWFKSHRLEPANCRVRIPEMLPRGWLLLGIDEILKMQPAGLELLPGPCGGGSQNFVPHPHHKP